MAAQTFLRIVRHTLLAAVCGLPLSSQAEPFRFNDVDYSKIENTVFGHALYTHTHDDPVKAIGILLNASLQGGLGKDEALAYIFMGDQLYAQGIKSQALDMYVKATQSAKKDKVRDTALLHFARIHHELGQHEAAAKAIAEIDDGNLSSQQEVEYEIIKAHTLLKADDIKKAINTLPSIRKNNLWSLYQRYNFGSELLGAYNNKNGASVLHELSRIDDEGNEEIMSLKDQSNLVLGFSLLKIDKAKKARKYFQQVRLNESMSAMALLGMGWSYAVEENYEKALVYWLELQGRQLGGAYGYESFLAIPYAFGKANAYQQSISFYQAALNRFETDISAMETTKAAITSKAFITMLSANPDDETAWIESWTPTKEKPEGLFLPLFMDNPEFQRHLQEYRELLALRLYVTSMFSDIANLEVRAGVSLAQLRQKQQLLINGIDKSLATKQPILQRLALNIIESYQSQLNNYLQQTRLGMAQVIEKATIENVPD